MKQTTTSDKRSLHGLESVNFFLADVQTGVGPFLAIYLAGHNWNEQKIGIALTVGGIAGIICQTPVGALIDQSRSKRALIAWAVAGLAFGSLLLALWPSLLPVLLSQILIGGVSSFFVPAVAAITLGMVGRKLFDRQTGRNQAFNSAGNVFTAASIGLLAYYLPTQIIFYFVIALCIPTLLSLWLIDPAEINNDVARGSDENGDKEVKPARLNELLKEKRLAIFCLAAVLFHFANAAMLPLLGEKLAHGHGKSSTMFMSACVITAQLIMVPVAAFAGKAAGAWGRKPLLLIGFAVLPIRGVLYTVVHDGAASLVPIQILDGVGAGIFGVVSVLVIADITRGTGRFNVAQGAVTTAVGIGAALSQTIAGGIVHHFNFNAAMLFLSGVAFIALIILAAFMPETKSGVSTRREDTLTARRDGFFS